MSYRIFTRTWWRDKACTVPGPGRKTTVDWAHTEEEAREICRQRGLTRFGPSMRGPKGLAYEYERV